MKATYCIVIPTYRRVKMLVANWAKIAQEYPIVVVARNEEAKEIIPEAPWLVRPIDLHKNGVGLPRFVGTEQSVIYDVVFQTDDDTKLLNPELIPEMAQIIKDRNILLGSKQPFDFGSKGTIPEFIEHKSGMVGFWGFPTEWLKTVGTFDPRFYIAEDHEFQWRARRAGHQMFSWTKFRVQHKHGLPGGLSEEHYKDRVSKLVKLWNDKYPGLVKASSNGKRLVFKKDYP